VLAACRVRYLRCPVDHLPSVAELQLLVPQSQGAARGPQAAPSVHQARDSLSTTLASRRRERVALWQDSSVFQDSFFAPDNRMDVTQTSGFGALTPAAGPVAAETPPAVSGTAASPPNRTSPPAP
jgi:hypothetical protein